ncbi:MAG TPA: hypothetical protein PKV65_18915 [Acidovorax defluvii]|jgi:hypothetical protein|nr:hypothetical protein [Acidovorax defluvii]
MTIEELEAEIRRVGSLLATAELQYETHSCFADAAKCDGYRARMEALAAERENGRSHD